MGYPLIVGCYLVAFAPAAALFVQLAAADPLKTILVVVGAFVWLLSLLLSSIVWICIPPLQDHLWFAIGAGIVFQEAARILCFFMLRAAQKGLAKMANPASRQHVDVGGVASLANSRHLLAVVIGIGMGVTAALFLTMNAFDAVAGSAVVGGIKEAIRGTPLRSPPSRLLPLHWAANAALISLFNVVWTVLVWDSCHHYALRRDAAAAAAAPAAGSGESSGSNSSSAAAAAAAAATASTPLLQNPKRLWALPAALAAVSHFASTAISYLAGAGFPLVAILLKFGLLITLVTYCYTLVRHEGPMELVKECLYALRDWITLAELRRVCCKKGQQQPAAAAAATATTSSEEDGVVIRDGGSSSVRQRREERT